MKFGKKTEKARRYAESLVEKVGCKDIPINEMYTEGEMKMLLDCVYEDKVMAVLYALFIGFSNGVKWRKEK